MGRNPNSRRLPKFSRQRMAEVRKILLQTNYARNVLPSVYDQVCYVIIHSYLYISDYFRCDTLNFSLSKSQKKVIKKFNKYLEDGVLIKNNVEPNAQGSDGLDSSGIFIKDRPNVNFSKIDNSSNQMQVEASPKLTTAELHCDKFNSIKNQDICGMCILYEGFRLHKKILIHFSISEPSQSKSVSKFPTKNVFKEGVGADTSKPPCKKAKLLRLERKKEKLLKQGLSLEKREPAQPQKSIEQCLEEVSQNSKHKLRVSSALKTHFKKYLYVVSRHRGY